jgi:CrcB protein
MQNLLLVAIGGTIGASGRYLFMQVMVFVFQSSFPIGTILVNVIGSFLMGFACFLADHYSNILSPQIKLLLMTGFLGGFTTFSTFSIDVFRLMSGSQFVFAFAYIFFSIAFSILAIFFGFYLTKLIFFL